MALTVGKHSKFTLAQISAFTDKRCGVGVGSCLSCYSSHTYSGSGVLFVLLLLPQVSSLHVPEVCAGKNPGLPFQLKLLVPHTPSVQLPQESLVMGHLLLPPLPVETLEGHLDLVVSLEKVQRLLES